MAEVDLLNTLNQTNQGFEIYEQNEQSINEAYLASVAIGEPEIIFNYAANILNVATQCPLTGRTINVSSLENGMYLYRIMDSVGNMIDTGQFIVNSK